jgi:Tfp pilus assembly protein PilO
MDNPKRTARIVLGTLLGLNLLAALLLLEAFGGSPEGLEANRVRLESQLQQQRQTLAGVGAVAAKMQTGEAEGARFIDTYFLQQRRAASEILQTLDGMEQRVGIRPRGKTFGVEAIEGTDRYVMLTIAANYEGTFADLVEFGSTIDQSERLLILDSLQVAPQQDGQSLQIQAQLYGFVRQNNETPTEVARSEDARPGEGDGDASDAAGMAQGARP